MKPQPEITPNQPEAIRSEIAETRHRMDDTLDALSARMRPRHLLDEVVGLFRPGNNDGESHMNHKIKDSATSAVNAVVSNVKQNPVPALLIGAGIAWMIYSRTRRSSEDESVYSEDDYGDAAGGTYGYYQENTTGYVAAGQPELSSETSGGLGDKLGSATGTLRDKASQASGALRDKASQWGHQASELGSRIADKSRDVYGRAREGVTHVAEDHPLGLGLGCLAAGIAIGLALPTPRRVSQLAGPTADRLRQRVRDAGKDVLERGKRVVGAATDAVKREAQSQGLTPEAARQRLSGDTSEQAGAHDQSSGADRPLGTQPAPAPQGGAATI